MNAAQRFYIALGINPIIVMLGHKVGKARSFTRRGPGRVHQQGKLQEEAEA